MDNICRRYLVIVNQSGEDDAVVGASVSKSEDLGSIPLSSQTKDLKVGIHSFPNRHERLKTIVKNKSANKLVVSLSKEVNGMPLPLNG